MVRRRIPQRGLLPAAATLSLAVLPCAVAEPSRPTEPAGTVQPPGSDARADAAPGLPSIDCVLTVREARIAEQGGDTNAAIGRLRQAVESCPEQLAARVELMAFLRRHEVSPGEAERLRGEVLSWVADPARPLPDGILGYLLDNPDLGDDGRREILDAVTARLEHRSGDAALMETAAGLYEELDRPAEARELYGKLQARQPDDLWLRWTCIELDRRLERWDEAIALLEPMVGREDAPAGVELAYADLLGRTGQHQKMVARLDAITAGLSPAAADVVRPAMLDILAGSAWHLWDQGQAVASEKLFRRMLELWPDDPEARAAVRYLFTAPEEVAEQQAALDRRWTEEDDPHALLERGGTLLAAGDAAAALDPLRRAVEGLPDSELAWFNLGLAASRVEAWEEAERALGRAVQLNAGRAESWLHRGAALEKLARCDEALDSLQAALELQPDLFQVHYYVYLCHRQTGNYEGSRDALQRYNEAKP